LAHQSIFTWIRLGFSFSAFGSVMASTPSFGAKLRQNLARKLKKNSSPFIQGYFIGR
jgi:hypothetical protein